MKYAFVKDPTPAKGLVAQQISLQHFTLERFLPSANLSEMVEHYWFVEWNSKNKQPYQQQNIPHPNQHIVINPQQQSGIVGIKRGAFTYSLKESGRVFGVKFLPGAFHCCYPHKLSELQNKTLPLNLIFDVDTAQLEDELTKTKDISQFIYRIDSLLGAQHLVLDDNARISRSIVSLIESNKSILSVTELCREVDISPRKLQRLFAHYIGASPKWVINRYRMLDAVTALNHGNKVDLTTLSHQLGYFDQAHFSKAFKSLTGQSPSAVKTVNANSI